MKNIKNFFLFLCFFNFCSFAANEQSCSLCSESFTIKQFACDEKCDAESDVKCIFCDHHLGVGKRIYKIELSEPMYFHYACLNDKNISFCDSCIKIINNKITRKKKINNIKNKIVCCFNNSSKCLLWSAVGISSIYVLYYFTMGAGSDNYCPCFFHMASSLESSCDFSKYPGCDKRIQ